MVRAQSRAASTPPLTAPKKGVGPGTKDRENGMSAIAAGIHFTYSLCGYSRNRRLAVAIYGFGVQRFSTIQ